MLIQPESFLMSMTNNESKKVRETPVSVSQIYGERFSPQMGRLIHFSEKIMKALDDYQTELGLEPMPEKVAFAHNISIILESAVKTVNKDLAELVLGICKVAYPDDLFFHIGESPEDNLKGYVSHTSPMSPEAMDDVEDVAREEAESMAFPDPKYGAYLENKYDDPHFSLEDSDPNIPDPDDHPCDGCMGEWGGDPHDERVKDCRDCPDRLAREDLDDKMSEEQVEEMAKVVATPICPECNQPVEVKDAKVMGKDVYHAFCLGISKEEAEEI